MAAALVLSNINRFLDGVSNKSDRRIKRLRVRVFRLPEKNLIAHDRPIRAHTNIIAKQITS